MTEPVTYNVQCMGSCIIPYIYQFEYDGRFPKKGDKPGYIKPKENFKGWFKYITKIMYYHNDNQENGANLTDCLSHEDNDGILILDNDDAQVILDYDTIFFEFPDEETALYFKMKYCS